MGNDGGSIARRDELVKVKVGKPVQEAARQRRARWSTCALSKKPLKQPVVADGLGRMYNKEALVNWLIQSKVNDAKGVKDEAGANMSHVRKLKDVTELKLHDNSAAKISKNGQNGSNGHQNSDDEQLPAPFACPLTGRPMNGSHRFVFIRAAGSGAVMSESGLKAVLGSSSSSSSSSSSAKATCPITSATFEPGYIALKAPASSSSSSGAVAPLTASNVADVIPLNPAPEEEMILRAVLQASTATGKKEKKNGKRKNGDEAATGAEDREAKGEKRPSPPSATMVDEAARAKRKRNEVDEEASQSRRSVSPPSASSATKAAAASIAARAAREARERERPASANVLKGIYGK